MVFLPYGRDDYSIVFFSSHGKHWKRRQQVEEAELFLIHKLKKERNPQLTKESSELQRDSLNTSDGLSAIFRAENDYNDKQCH